MEFEKEAIDLLTEAQDILCLNDDTINEERKEKLRQKIEIFLKS